MLERELEIIALAHQLLNQVKFLSESEVDAEFLFRFDPRWCSWVTVIREMIRSLMQQEGSGPLSEDNNLHGRWVWHLQRNQLVSVSMGTKGLKVHGPFVPFKRETTDDLWKGRRDKRELEEIRLNNWLEANQISKISSEIERLALAYGLIPWDHELDDYSAKESRTLYERVFNWVVWGKRVPQFRWPFAYLIESETKKRGQRTIHPKT